MMRLGWEVGDSCSLRVKIYMMVELGLEVFVNLVMVLLGGRECTVEKPKARVEWVVGVPDVIVLV